MSSLFMRRLFFPTAPAGGGGITPAPPPVERTPWMPEKEADISSVATKVGQSWTANPQITLIWLTAAQFNAQAAAYAASIGSTNTASGNRPAQTQVLDALDKEIDTNLGALKIDILGKWGRANGPSQYSRYGIEKKYKKYVLPADRDQRFLALKMIPAALTADNIRGTYDAAYWTAMITNYQRAMSTAGTTDSTVSNLVGTKEQQKEQVLKGMRALIHAIQANYPDTYEAILRQWGWQKGKY